MQIYKVDPVGDPRWADFVCRSPCASVFHSPQWLQLIRLTYGYEPIAFTTSPPSGEIKNGLVFCHVGTWFTANRMVSVPFSDHCEPLVDTPEEFEFLMNCLRAEMEHRDWAYIEIRPVNGQFNWGGEGHFFPGTSFYLHRVDLLPSLDEIFKTLDKDSVQRRIRRSERAGITYQCGRSEELLRDFYNLLVLTRRRHHLPPPPYRWFRNMADCMQDALQIRLAYKDALPIAAVLTLQFQKTVYYKYVCSDARYHNLAAIPALLWRTIEDSKTAGMNELDLGRSDCENKGLIAFKNHWTRKRSRLVYWRYPKPGHLATPEGWKLRVMKHVFACMPNRMLIVAGRLLYRHTG